MSSGTTVLVTWGGSSQGVRYYQLLDDEKRIGGHVPPGKNKASATLSYGTHCVRVVAVAEGKNKDSKPSQCAKVTVEEPAPDIVGSYKGARGGYLGVYSDGGDASNGSFAFTGQPCKGTWKFLGGNRFQFRDCNDSLLATLQQDGSLIFTGFSQLPPGEGILYTPGKCRDASCTGD